MGGKVMCFGVEPVQEKNSYTQSDTLFPLMLWKPGQLLTEILPLFILRGVFRIQKVCSYLSASEADALMISSADGGVMRLNLIP